MVRMVSDEQLGTRLRTTADVPTEATVREPLDAAFAATAAAYLKLGIDIGTRDAAHHIVGNTQVVASRTFHGSALSKYFSCGADMMGRALADQYIVTFSVVSSLSLVDSVSTKVSTLVNGYGVSRGTSTTPTYCSSTGALEQDIVETARGL